jgi:hypothetical protein
MRTMFAGLNDCQDVDVDSSNKGRANDKDGVKTLAHGIESVTNRTHELFNKPIRLYIQHSYPFRSFHESLFTNVYRDGTPHAYPYVLETCQMSSNALLQCVLPIVATFDSQTISFTTIRPLSLCSREIVADLQGEPCK